MQDDTKTQGNSINLWVTLPTILSGSLASLGVNGLLGGRQIRFINRALFEQVSHSWALFNGALPFLIAITYTVTTKYFADYLPKWIIKDGKQNPSLHPTVLILAPIGVSLLGGSSFVQAIVLYLASIHAAEVAFRALDYYGLVPPDPK